MKDVIQRESACVGSQSDIFKRDKSRLLLLLLALLLAWLPPSVLAQEGGANRAGLIVVHGDGRVLTRCVTFTEDSISGVALLQRSGLAVDANTGPMGSAVCTINSEGCPANDCFCQCKSNPCTYWNYFHRNVDGSWAYSGMGAATWTVSHGDIDGWVWGDGSAPPPALAFDAICGTESAPPASSPDVPAATPLLPETPIPTPTAQPVSSTLAPATSTVAPTATIATSTISASTASPTPTATTSSSPMLTTATPAPTHSVTVSPTRPLTYTLSFPAISSPSTSPYRAPNPLREYVPFVIILISVVGLALLKRKR